MLDWSAIVIAVGVSTIEGTAGGESVRSQDKKCSVSRDMNVYQNVVVSSVSIILVLHQAPPSSPLLLYSLSYSSSFSCRWCRPKNHLTLGDLWGQLWPGWPHLLWPLIKSLSCWCWTAESVHRPLRIRENYHPNNSQGRTTSHPLINQMKQITSKFTAI